VAGNLSGTFDPKQMAGKPDIPEIELWRLDEPFVEIVVVRLQQGDDKTGLQQ